jgi:hypothetical protein
MRTALAASLLLVALTAAADGQVKGIEAIPVTRLVTDGELLALADLPEAVAKIRSTRGELAAVQALVKHVASRTAPVYFFTPAEVPARITLYRSQHPGTAEKAVRQAEEFFETFGADVDWRVPGADRTGKAHTPNTVRLLARQWQAENIALRYYLNNRDRSSINFLMAHMQDFVQDFEAGRTEKGGNDIFERFYAGHRARNLMLAHHILLGTNDYRWEDQAFMVKLFILHAAKLYEGSRKFNWGNHQLVGLTGLFEISTMFPEFPLMRALNKHALGLIVEHLEKEIFPDGFQFERASHYFKLDIVNYFRVYRLASLNGIELPEVFHVRFRKMFDAIVALAMPNRSLPVLQDAQDTYLTGAGAVDARSGVGEARSSNAAELAEPNEDVFMALGALLYNEPSYKYFSRSSFPPAFFWFMDTTASARYKALGTVAPTIGSIGLPDTRYYVMRSGWDSNDRYLVIDGGLAQYKPDHTHGGILGVMMYAYGEPLLPTYRVKYSDPAYITMKNSLVKNVALADTLLQGRSWRPNAARTGFGIWLSLPKPAVTSWWTGNAFDFFSGTHNGFDTIGVHYARDILFVKPDYWLFRDRLTSDRPHTAQQIWQGNFENHAPDVAVRSIGTSHVAILQADALPLRTSAHIVEQTSSIWFEHEPAVAPEFTTFIMPSTGAQASIPALRQESHRGYRMITLTLGTTRDVVVESDGSEWDNREVRSNARLAVQRGPDGRIETLLFKDATTMTVAGTQLRTKERTTTEWTRAAAGAWTVRLLAGAAEFAEVVTKKGTKRVSFKDGRLGL